MRLGPVHVVVAAPSAALRSSLVAWLQQSKRVRIVRAVSSATELGAQAVDCDLVVASGLAGPRELRAIAKRYAGHAGLVALSLGLTPLPAGWTPLAPGLPHERVLEHAIPHPERSVASTWTINGTVIVALAGLLLASAYVRDTSLSFERAALAYAARWPDAATWWHVWGGGAPYLASAGWPLLRLAAAGGNGGPDAFTLLVGVLAAVYGAAFTLLAVRAGAKRLAPLAALVVVGPPALWAWARDGDATSLAGLAGIALVLAGTRVTRLRVTAVALAVAVAAFGGYAWVALCALIAVVAGIRARRARASLSGAFLGAVLASAVAAPPLLSRGLDGLRPPLARLPAASDLAPVIASLAVLALLLARGRVRWPVRGIAAVALVLANALAIAAPVTHVDAADIPSTGGLGRLAIHPAEALAYAAAHPDLPTSGADLDPALVLGTLPKAVANARLEWEGADRALLPDRSAALVFNERDWSVIDRDRLLFGAPRVRPILTAGITPTILVVADEGDARVFGDALIRLGSTSDRVLTLRSTKQLDDLDRDTLRQFTMIAVYGQPWKDIARAEAVLDDYLQLSGFVFMDAAGRAGKQPLLPEARTIRAGPDEARIAGDHKDLITADGYDGRVVGIDAFAYRGDSTFEQAALAVGTRRVIEFGQTRVASEVSVSTHVVWSGVDLPARAAAGEAGALAQFQSALSWMLGAARVTPTQEYGVPAGDRLDNDTATSTFVDGSHWRIELHAASTGVLFKERYHPQWRAFQVDVAPRSGQESRTALPIVPTTHGFMYVTLSPNARTIEFVFERHPYESATRGVAGVALFVTIGLTVFLWRRR
jgi:hypothetical protein